MKHLAFARLLAALCLLLPLAAHAEQTETDNTSDGRISVDKLAKQDGRWAHVRFLLDVPANSPGFEATCCWILGANQEIKTMQDYIDSQLKAYNEVEPYNEKKFLKQSSKKDGADVNLCDIKPKGDALGSLQMYSIKKTDRVGSEKMFFELSIVYDKARDKVLMVDDIFVPEMAAKIKADFGEDFINMDVSDFRILCGYANGGEGFDYRDHIYNYSRYESDLTNYFKQSIGFGKLSSYFAKKEKEEEDSVYSNNVVHISSRLGMEWEELKEFFDKNFHWPDELKKKDYYGAFLVYWVVEKDGSISNVDITIIDTTLNVSPLEKEMERVMKSIPHSTPGLVNNIPVRTGSLFFFEFDRKKSSGIKLGIEEIFQPKTISYHTYHNYQTVFKRRERIPIRFR